MSAELWTAVAVAVIGPSAAVLSGVGSFWLREQRERASQRYLDDGALKLLGIMSARFSVYLLNYQIANYIIRVLKTYERGGPLAPEPAEIPQFLDVTLDTLPIDAVLPVRELVGDQVVMEWILMALSDLTLFAKEVDFQIRQPLVAYYRADAAMSLDRDTAVERLSGVLDAWEGRLQPHFALLDRLHDLIAHVERKRPWTSAGYATISNRHELREMRVAWSEGYNVVKRAREDAEPTLRADAASS